MSKFIEDMERAIRSEGCCLVDAEDMRGVPYTHTVGLTDRGWPELLVVGPPSSAARGLLLRLVAMLEEDRGERGPVEGRVVEGLSPYPSVLVSVSPGRRLGYLLHAMYRQQRVCGPAPEALQLVLSDPDGWLPGHPLCSSQFSDPQTLAPAPVTH